MRDFREVSTIELFYDTTKKLEKSTKTYSEIKDRNVRKVSEELHKRISKEIEDDFRIPSREEMDEIIISDLKMEAEDGNAEAQYDLACYYMPSEENDTGDISKSFILYKKAAQNGIKEAQYNLACFYVHGIGIDKDEDEAFIWIEKSANQGYTRAKFCLALCYEHGIGVDKDEKKAYEILKSLENDKIDTIVQYCLGIYYEKGKEIEKDKKKAFEFYKNCANAGYDKAQLRTAICYEYGIGVKQDHKKAFNRYKKAVGNGNKDAKYLMGRCYEYGIGTNVDSKKAFSIYNELSQVGYEDAMYRLAYFYEHGIGTDIDKEKAFKLYNNLAQMGYEDAMFYLTEHYEDKMKNSDTEEFYNTEEVVADLDVNNEGSDVLVLEEVSDKEKLDLDVKLEKNMEIEEFSDLEDSNLDNNEEIYAYEDFEDESLLSKDLGINIFLEQTIYKQVKDNNLESDLKKLIIKIDKCLTSTNGALNFKSLGFKKYEGVGNNKIYGFDFNNKVNDSDRIIACFVDDYAKKNEFDFERYNNSQNKDKQGIILFSITKHNDQEREAQKVSKRINNSFYEHNQFKYVNEKKSKNIEIISVVNKNTQENNMTFRSLDFDDKQIIYQEVLTKEQSEQIHTFIQKSEPFILSGIAGSGKTISTVKLIPDMVEKIKNMGSDSKILYVTFSNNLKQYVKEKVIESYYEFNEYIDIKTFEDICTELNYKYNNKKIDRSRIITQNTYKKNFTKFLNYLHQTSRDGNILKFIKKYQKEKNIIYSEIFGILKGSMYVDWDREEKDIVKSEYYINNSNKIVEDYKIFAEEDREILYSITQKYNQWLVENEYYDINDIAFELQSLIKDKNINYEYVVVDEVQDFTEVQIYMLFLLAKEQEIYGKNKTRKILLAGDPNQIINPTFFKVGRLRKLFYLHGYNYEDKRLNENFRNSINIMKMNNIVNKIINDKLPARKEEDRQYEITKNNKTGIVEQVKASDENLKVIFTQINASAKVALIVSDDEKKEYLKEKYGCENAFTISEFKGKEFDNIIVYNILSDYADIYEEVYKKESLKEGHYSYYFNRFYVSITRANYNLVLIEEKETEILKEIKEKLGDNLRYIENIDTFKDLNLGELIGDSSELFNIGMKFFYDEEYAQAKNYFTRSVEPNSNNLAKICDLFEQEGKYDEKGDELFHIGEYKLAQTYYEKAYNFEKYAIMYLYMNNLSYEKQLREFYKCLDKQGINFSDLFDNYGYRFDKLHNILKNKIKKTNKLSSNIGLKIKNVNQLLGDINKKMNGR